MGILHLTDESKGAGYVGNMQRPHRRLHQGAAGLGITGLATTPTHYRHLWCRRAQLPGLLVCLPCVLSVSSSVVEFTPRDMSSVL